MKRIVDLRFAVLALIVMVGYALGLDALGEPPDQNERRPSVPKPRLPVDVRSANLEIIQNPTQNAKRDDWIRFAWDTFIALNWPKDAAEGNGAPDESVDILDERSSDYEAAWMSYLTKTQVFLPGAQDPGSWDTPTKQPASIDGVVVMGGLTKIPPGKDLTGFAQSMSGLPLIDQNGNYVLYQILVNRSEYTWIQSNRYYDALVQKKSSQLAPLPTTGNPTDFDPPVELPKWARQGAVEVKASWRILTSNDDPQRFLSRKAYFMAPDGKAKGPFDVGLVGLHIGRRTPGTTATWFWSTFEQVDNLSTDDETQLPSFNPGPGRRGPKYPKGFSRRPKPIVGGGQFPEFPKPVNVSRVTPIPEDVMAWNAAYQEMLGETVWRHYKLVGVLFPVEENVSGAVKMASDTNAYVNVDDLVNSTMETYTQAGFNCTFCHRHATWQGQTKTTAKNRLFTFLLDHADES